jgi:hypothetical protein
VQPPSDTIESAIVTEVWPADETITVLNAFLTQYDSEHTSRLNRYDELNRSKSAIHESMQSEDFDSMHDRLTQIAKNQRTLAENAEVVISKGRMMVDECELGQQLLMSVAQEFAPTIRKLLDDHQFQTAALELAVAQGEAAAKIGTLVETVEAWLGQALSAIHQITPSGHGNGKRGSHDNGVSPVDFTRPKQEGPGAGGGSGYKSGGRDAPEEGDNKGTESHGAKEQEGHGRRSGDADRPDESQPGVGSAAGKNDLGHRAGNADHTPSPQSPGQTPQLPSAPSSPLGGGSGGGTPSPSGLTSGLGGFKPPSSLEGMSSMARPTPPSLPANPASSLGSGSGSGGGAPRFSSPVPSAVPPASVPPAALSQAVGASPSTTTGGFGPSSNALQPITHTPAVSSTGGMGAGAMGGVMASAAPTTAAVGPSPTPSPGLAQGAVNASSAAGTGAAGASASGVNVMPSAFSDESPQRLDQFAQMAVNAVKVLSPAMAGMPGLLVAAAVVRAPGGIPQVVITTNEGAGYLPQGCFLPSTMTHAFFDVDQLDFDNKWFGWVDPARTLVDYVAVRSAAVSGEVELLGLASSGLVSADVKSAFPQAVPSVRPDDGVKPLGPDGGRNAHRLKVLSPSWFADVQGCSAEDRNKAAVRATEAVMRLPVAAPLREAGGPWQIMQSGRPLDEAEWAAFKDRYDQEVKMTGAVRPGFMTSSQPGQMGAQYVERFQLVRAMETLLAWRDISAVSPEDIIYTAHEAGADISHVLD